MNIKLEDMFEVSACSKCGIPIVIPAIRVKQHEERESEDDVRAIYCASGHKNFFGLATGGESPEKLTAKLAEAKQAIAQLTHDREQLEARVTELSAKKGRKLSIGHRD